MKIYTRKGDRGITSLFDGTRVKKNNKRVEAYGTVDELNSLIGIVLMLSQKSKSQKHIAKVISELMHIQKDLFEIGAVLANPSQEPGDKIINSLKKRTASFEHFIDAMTSELPKLTNFILPGGLAVGSFLQLTRALSRRAERNIVGLSQAEAVPGGIIIYFNRLSDLLFTMSRYANFKEGIKEKIWTK